MSRRAQHLIAWGLTRVNFNATRGRSRLAIVAVMSGPHPAAVLPQEFLYLVPLVAILHVMA